jgi:hypothetical protein
MSAINANPAIIANQISTFDRGVADDVNSGKQRGKHALGEAFSDYNPTPPPKEGDGCDIRVNGSVINSGCVDSDLVIRDIRRQSGITDDGSGFTNGIGPKALDEDTIQRIAKRATQEVAGSQKVVERSHNSTKPLMTFNLANVPLLEGNFSDELREQLNGVASQIRNHDISAVKIDGYGFLKLFGTIRAQQVNDYLSYLIPASINPRTKGYSGDTDFDRAMHRAVIITIYGTPKTSSGAQERAQQPIGN